MLLRAMDIFDVISLGLIWCVFVHIRDFK